MINQILNRIKKIDELTYKIMKKGLIFSLMLCLLSAFILFIYSSIFVFPNVYYIGLSLFKLSCFLGVEFIVCGLVIDTIVN